jgi:hypothetical protein
MHDESLYPRAYAKLHADRYLWQEQQERASESNRKLDEIERLVDVFFAAERLSKAASNAKIPQG